MSTATTRGFWQRISLISSQQTFQTKTEIFRQGSIPQAAYFINRGLVKLVRLESDGQEMIINLLTPGRLLGAATAITQRQYDLTAIALTECELQCIPSEKFLQLIKSDAEFSWEVLQACSRNIISLNARLAQLAAIPARQRLEHLLRQLISTQEASDTAINIRVRMPIKHKEIAQMLAISEPYLSQLFKQLYQEGILRKDGRGMIVIDLQRLWRGDDFEQF